MKRLATTTIEYEDRSSVMVMEVDGPARREARIVDQTASRLSLAMSGEDGPITDRTMPIPEGGAVLVALPTGGWMLGTLHHSGDGHVNVVQVAAPAR